MEYWAVLAGAALYVATRDAEREALTRRFVKTAASALLTFGLSETIAAMLGVREIVVAVGIMALGLLALDVATALVSDREFIKEMIRRRIGKGRGDE